MMDRNISTKFKGNVLNTLVVQSSTYALDM